MITRDNKASISGTAQSARARLGEIIAFYMRERDYSARDVSRRVKVGQPLVEDWINGREVPNRDQWKGLCQGVNRNLHAHQDVYDRARAEAEDEARQRAAKNQPKEQSKPMRQDTKINTALADKLGTALTTTQTGRATAPIEVVTPTAPPLRVVTELHPPLAADGRKLQPVRPPGSHSTENVERRKEYVRRLLISSPNKRTQGADSVVEHVRREFGVGISPETVDEIREELKRERIKAEIIAELPPPVPPTMPAMAAQLLEKIATPIADNKVGPAQPTNAQQAHLDAMATPEPGDLQTAVQLILEALPGLQTFSITVDESGEASVDYQIRKVKIETVGGSIKVRK
jgi:hypothetical protein